MFHSAGAWLKPNVFPGILSKLLAANAASLACNLQQFFCKSSQALQFFLNPMEKKSEPGHWVTQEPSLCIAVGFWGFVSERVSAL